MKVSHRSSVAGVGGRWEQECVAGGQCTVCYRTVLCAGHGTQMLAGFGFLHLEDRGSTFFRKLVRHALRTVKGRRSLVIWTGLLFLLFCDQSGCLKARGAAERGSDGDNVEGLDEEMRCI